MTDSTNIMNAPQSGLTTENRIATADYILVDGSGSMYAHWADAMAALDAYVIERGPVHDKIVMTIFDGSHNRPPRLVTARDSTPATWARVSDGETQPLGGMTPLYDGINAMGRWARDTNPIRPGVAIIVTDGEENCSTTTQVQAKAILDWMRAKGWTIKFIGANFDNSKQAAVLGGDKTEAIGVSSARLIDAAKALAKKRNLHAQYGTPMAWSEQDHEQFGGYLGHSK